MEIQKAMRLLAEVEQHMGGGKFHSDLCSDIHAACDEWFGEVRPQIAPRIGTADYSEE